MKINVRNMLQLALAVITTPFITGCDSDTPVENAAERIEAAGDKVGDAVEDAADETEDAVDDVADSARDAVN